MKTEARAKILKDRDQTNSVREGTFNSRLIASYLTNQGEFEMYQRTWDWKASKQATMFGLSYAQKAEAADVNIALRKIK